MKGGDREGRGGERRKREGEGSVGEGRGRDPTPSRPLMHISGYARAPKVAEICLIWAKEASKHVVPCNDVPFGGLNGSQTSKQLNFGSFN